MNDPKRCPVCERLYDACLCDYEEVLEEEEEIIVPTSGRRKLMPIELL